MKRPLRQTVMTALRWTIGVVIFLESAHFLISTAEAHRFAATGLPHWIRLALGGIEAVAALLFLAPAAVAIGGYGLLFTFAIAALIHFGQGHFDIGNLVIYAMAVVACIADRFSPERGSAT